VKDRAGQRCTKPRWPAAGTSRSRRPAARRAVRPPRSATPGPGQPGGSPRCRADLCSCAWSWPGWRDRAPSGCRAGRRSGPVLGHGPVQDADVGAIADSEQSPVGLVVGEPPGQVGALQLPVQRRRWAQQRVLPALQVLDQGRVRLTLTDAPSGEGAGPGQPTPPGVVRPGLGDPVIDRCIRQCPRM